MNRYLMEHREQSWTSICVVVPGVEDDHMLPADIGERKSDQSSRCLRALCASLSLYSTRVCEYTYVRRYWWAVVLRPYLLILPPPLAVATSFAWLSRPRQPLAIIFPLANLSALISIIPCLLRALTALTAPLSEDKTDPHLPHFTPPKFALASDTCVHVCSKTTVKPTSSRRKNNWCKTTS